MSSSYHLEQFKSIVVRGLDTLSLAIDRLDSSSPSTPPTPLIKATITSHSPLPSHNHYGCRYGGLSYRIHHLINPHFRHPLPILSYG